MNLSKAVSSCLRLSAIAGLALLAQAPCAQAFVFEFGDVKGNFDTTLSVGGFTALIPPIHSSTGSDPVVFSARTTTTMAI